MDQVESYANVVLPLAIKGTYTYKIPDAPEFPVRIGARVIVPFGKKKIYSGIVWKMHTESPDRYKPREIMAVLDPHPIINSHQIIFWEWISEYYMCSLGEVMIAALPSALKLQSETKVELNPDFDGDLEDLDDKEYLITEALQTGHVLSLDDISKIIDQKTVMPLIRTMIEKKIVLVEEEVKNKYKPLRETRVSLSPDILENDLEALFKSMELKAPRQLEMLMAFLSLSYRDDHATEIPKKMLMNSVKGGESAFRSLVQKKIFVLGEHEIDRIKNSGLETKEVAILSKVQKDALAQIRNHFVDRDTVLLHGVTSSGKTEIYTHLINECLDSGKSVLYLLPEIALTAQIINRLRRHFGDEVGVYHSRFNDQERVEVWNRVIGGSELTTTRSGEFNVILGARSAVFLPFHNLGLIIIDEEHEQSFKQYDPAPRYHARDSAIMLAHIHGAKTVIGSATPSIESYTNALNEKFGLVEMNERFGGIALPQIVVVDIADETKRKKMKSHFSSFLLEKMEEVLTVGEQVILFQNRRGFAPVMECLRCAWVPQCINCDVSLTYHKSGQQMRCHYCGFSEVVPSTCTACGSHDVRLRGFGTEKIEEDLQIYFPETKIARMDLDTTRSKHAYSQIINDFEEKRIDVLVGTQMVTKGLDFDNVSLVGVLNADTMLTFPDFRAYERSFQLMAQVSGRSGRKGKQGMVVVQTRNPQHYIIGCVVDTDYEKVYRVELGERERFKYPPFYRLIHITVKSKNKSMADRGAVYLANELSNLLGNRVLGPEEPYISRIRNYYIRNILVKIEKEASLVQVKHILTEKIISLHTHADFKSVITNIDVDPQ
jgi:primosomal protein N' (replication factor Y) (superfamily II helicase)